MASHASQTARPRNGVGQLQNLPPNPKFGYNEQTRGPTPNSEGATVGMRDQLLKAGLVKKKDAQKAAGEKRKLEYEAKKNKEIAENLAKQKAAEEARIAAELAAKQERDRHLNQERDAQAREREKIYRVKQTIESNRHYELHSQLSYFFYGRNQEVTRLLVTLYLREMLARGRFGITCLERSTGEAEYVIVPAHTIQVIRNVLPEYFTVLHAYIEDTVELTEDFLNNETLYLGAPAPS